MEVMEKIENGQTYSYIPMVTHFQKGTNRNNAKIPQVLCSDVWILITATCKGSGKGLSRGNAAHWVCVVMVLFTCPSPATK